MVRRGVLRGRAVPSVARFAVLIACLGGLFAMHGLSDHGMTTSMTMSATADPVVSGGTSGPPTDVAPTVTIHRSPPTGPAARDDRAVARKGSGGLMGHDMGDMCIAVLAGSLVLLLAAAAARCRLQHALRRVIARGSADHAATSPRAGPPRAPDLIALCIQRC